MLSRLWCDRALMVCGVAGRGAAPGQVIRPPRTSPCQSWELLGTQSVARPRHISRPQLPLHSVSVSETARWPDPGWCQEAARWPDPGWCQEAARWPGPAVGAPVLIALVTQAQHSAPPHIVRQAGRAGGETFMRINSRGQFAQPDYRNSSDKSSRPAGPPPVLRFSPSARTPLPQ